jgi:type III secretory pathway component EscV
VLPVIVFVAVAVPLLIVGFVIARQRNAAGERPVAETDADRQREEQEFEDAERYQEQWREGHKHDLDHL